MKQWRKVFGLSLIKVKFVAMAEFNSKSAFMWIEFGDVDGETKKKWGTKGFMELLSHFRFLVSFPRVMNYVIAFLLQVNKLEYALFFLDDHFDV